MSAKRTELKIEHKKDTKTDGKATLTDNTVKRLIVCPRCRGESDRPIKRGKNDTIYRCFDCNKAFIGSPPSKVHHLKKCPICDTFNNKVIEEHEVWEELVSMYICSDCAAEIQRFSDVVEAGGVYWECSDCKNSGVIVPNDFAREIREVHGVFPPDPTGVIFSKKNCPVCTNKIIWHTKTATA